MLCDSAHSARVGINGLLTFALELEQTQVPLIKLIKSVRFGFFHGIPPFGLMAPGIEPPRELYNDLRFFSAAIAASFNNCPKWSMNRFSR
jgi:hypothetical protein